MQIFATVFIIVLPLIRIFFLNIQRHHTRKDCITAILCRGREYAEEHILIFRAELLINDWRNRSPLIKSKVINQYHEGRSIFGQIWSDLVGKYIVRHDRDVLSCFIDPVQVVAGYKFEKFGVSLNFLTVEYLQHFRAVTFTHFQFPVHQFFVQILPFTQIRVRV
ncbi:hypothetical protein D3C72_947530 [compost metagenome]